MPPQRLYRYRSLPLGSTDARRWAREVLLEHRVFFPAGSSFNDPFELRPRILPNQSPADRIVYESDVRRRRFKHAPNSQWLPARSLARARASSPDNLRRMVDTHRQEYGFISLTEACDSLLMWAHYSDSHRGYCLEFSLTANDWKRDFMPFKVEYSSARPRIPTSLLLRSPNRLSEAERSQLVRAMFLTKSNEWSYEREWRVLSESSNSKVDIRPSALTAVILGANMAANDRRFIARTVAKRSPSLRVMQATIHAEDYKLNIEDLDPNTVAQLAGDSALSGDE